MVGVTGVIAFTTNIHRQNIFTNQTIWKTSIFIVIAVAVSDQVRTERTEQPTRAYPLCSACRNPMKGHKSVTDCPRNRK